MGGFFHCELLGLRSYAQNMTAKHRIMISKSRRGSIAPHISKLGHAAVLMNYLVTSTMPIRGCFTASGHVESIDHYNRAEHVSDPPLAPDELTADRLIPDHTRAQGSFDVPRSKSLGPRPRRRYFAMEKCSNDIAPLGSRDSASSSGGEPTRVKGLRFARWARAIGGSRCSYPPVRLRDSLKVTCSKNGARTLLACDSAAT